MDFYVIEKFKGLLMNGCWPIGPQGLQISLDDSEDSFDSAAEEDDEEYLKKIFYAHSLSQNSLLRGEPSHENLKRIIIREMPVTAEYAEQSARNAEELMKEEEREKLKLERRKERKRRRRERKKAGKDGSKTGIDDDDDEDEENDDLERENNHKQSRKKSEKSKKDKNGFIEDEQSGIEDDTEGLDVNSAFVTKLVKNKLRTTLNNGSSIKSSSSNSFVKGNSLTSPKRTANGSRIVTIPERNVLLGERLAAAGYECASNERYKDAIELFTRALRNVPNDHRYWGNRSFCYFQIGEYQKALEDADCAIRLAPTSPKGHYRRAEALAGLKNIVAAEAAFERVLELDTDCEDARQELLNIRLLRLTEMGFNRKRAYKALLKHTTMEAAIEALMAIPEGCESDDDTDDVVYNSDGEINWDDIGTSESLNDSQDMTCEDEVEQLHFENLAIDGNKISKKQAAMDPSNPNRCVSIWVGNIEEAVSEKDLNDMFSRFGQILSIRMLPSSHCAFINFKDSKAPGPAMAAMQGKQLGGNNLLIRYPNKTKEEQQLHQQMMCHQKRMPTAIGDNVTISGAGAAVSPSAASAVVCASAGAVGATGAAGVAGVVGAIGGAVFNSGSHTTGIKTTLVPTSKGTRVKLKGPVNGDECYYWRTTGCAFGDNCRNKHIKDNRGIDRKPWHK